MFNYKVTVKAIDEDETQPGAFVGINMGEGYAEFDEFDKDGNEVYTVVSDNDISRQLDLSDGVISYNG